MMAHEKNISQFNCLVCAQPDLAATDIDKDDYLMLFAVLLKEHVSIEDYQLFQKKATEFSLLKDTNFRWCAHVSIQDTGRVISKDFMYPFRKLRYSIKTYTKYCRAVVMLPLAYRYQ